MKRALLLLSGGLVLALLLAHGAEAANIPPGGGPGGGSPSPSASPPPDFKCQKDAAGKCSQLLLGTDPCVKISLPILSNGSKCDGGAGVDNKAGQGGAIVIYLRDILTLLSGAVAVVIVLMLVIAGVQYITSAGDPGLVKSAKNRIINAVTALLLFLMMFAILQFLVPGGIL